MIILRPNQETKEQSHQIALSMMYAPENSRPIPTNPQDRYNIVYYSHIAELTILQYLNINKSNDFNYDFEYNNEKYDIKCNKLSKLDNIPNNHKIGFPIEQKERYDKIKLDRIIHCYIKEINKDEWEIYPMSCWMYNNISEIDSYNAKSRFGIKYTVPNFYFWFKNTFDYPKLNS